MYIAAPPESDLHIQASIDSAALKGMQLLKQGMDWTGVGLDQTEEVDQIVLLALAAGLLSYTQIDGAYGT